MAEVGRLVRSGFWLYLSTLTTTLSGFIYWLIISRIAGPRILGLTTAVIGLASLFNGIISFGINIALQRFVGECRGKHDDSCESKYFWGSFITSFSIYTVTGVLLLALGLSGKSFLGYSPAMLEATGIIVLLGIWSIVYSYFIGALETKTIFTTVLIGNIAKITVGILLVYLGYGWVGALTGYASSWAVMLVILSPRALAMNLPISLPSLDEIKTLFKAGVSNWAPAVLTLIGQWIGVIAVFGYSGAVQTGYYYVANTIAMFVLGVSTMIMGVMIPVLSGMQDGRKRLAWSALRISLAIIAPITAYLVFYPESILGLLGHAYTRASLLLSVLAIGYIPVLLTTGILNLVYAYGMYKETLYIGLYQNVPRVILYLILTPIYQGLGTALSMATGGVTGLAYAYLISRKIQFKIEGRKTVETIIAPFSVLALIRLLNMHWIIGGMITLLTYAYYTKRSILTRNDLKQLFTSLLGEKTVNKTYNKLKWLIDWLITS